MYAISMVKLRGWTMRLIAALFVGLFAVTAYARLVPLKDPLDGVLDADLVIIVRPAPSGKPGIFRIEEVFLGGQHVGDSIDLGDFKLSITQQWGPPIVEPFTPTTRILLFLQRTVDSSALWKPTYFGESYFWVQRFEDEALLRRAAERAVDLRRQWEKAASISDPKQRVVELWPFLSLHTFGVSFLEHTQLELQKAAPDAGEYFAERFDEMSHDERMLWLAEAGAYGSKNLHEKLIKHLGAQQHIYEECVASLGGPSKLVNWNTMPRTAQDAVGEIYYGLGGLARFRDQNDLPLFRTISLWSAKYHQEQPAEATMLAFRDMPDRANLPAIKAVLDEFLPKPQPGMGIIDWDVERSLCQHKYTETIPLLVPFTANVTTPLAQEAEYCLAQIVERDLGRSPGAWMDWYLVASKATP